MHDDTIVPECDRLPFDVEKARAGEPVCDGGGIPHRIICFDRKGGDCPIITLSMSAGREVAQSFSNSGRIGNSSMATSCDLRMAPRKPKRWWVVSWGHKYAADGKPASVMYEDEAVARAYHARLDSCLGAVVSFTDIPE